MSGVHKVGLVIALDNSGNLAQAHIHQVIIQVIGLAGAGTIDLGDEVRALVALGFVGALCQLQSGEAGGGDDQAVCIIIHQCQLLLGEGGQIIVVLGTHIGVAELCGGQINTGGFGFLCSRGIATAGGERAGQHRNCQQDGDDLLHNFVPP